MVIKLSKKNECYLVELGHSWVDGEQRFFRRNMMIPKWMIPNAVTRFKNSGLFVTAYAYDRPNQDEAYLYGDFYLDFDTQDIQNGFDKIRRDALYSIAYLKDGYKIPIDDIQIYFSGKKGLHVIVPKECFDIEAHQKLNVVFKELATKIKAYTVNKTVDTQIYDNKRIFRYPGSIHERTGFHKISLTFDELKTLSISEIEELAKAPRVFSYPTPVASMHAKTAWSKLVKDVEAKLNNPIMAGGVSQLGVLRSIPPCIKHLIENGATEGSRNNTLAVLVSFHKRRGLSFEETLKTITEWNDTLVSPIGSHELKASTKSIYQTDKIYGCSALKEISICTPKECQLKRGR